MTARQMLLPGPPVRIQRKRNRGWRMPVNTVYVGRPTRYGNMFTIGDTPGCGEMKNCDCESHCEGLSAEDVVDLYRTAQARYFSADDLAAIRGKNLACWCPLDQPCHADVLLEIANRPQANK